MTNKKLGNFWIVIGLLFLLGAGGLTAYNIHMELQAQADSNVAMDALNLILETADKTVVTQQTTRPSSVVEAEAEEEPVQVNVNGLSYMAVITIPALNLQLPVQQEWSYANLQSSPCRMSGSFATGDLVILGHNYRTHFGPLSRLKIGDEVSVTTLDGTTYVYYVDVTEIVDPTAVESVTSGAWPLTLFTCTLTRTTRLVIRCDMRD